MTPLPSPPRRGPDAARNPFQPRRRRERPRPDAAVAAVLAIAIALVALANFLAIAGRVAP